MQQDIDGLLIFQIIILPSHIEVAETMLMQMDYLG